MRERPIVMKAHEVRAVLAGATQVRRAIAGPIEYLGPRGAEADPKNWGWAYDGKHGGGYMVVARGVNNPCGNNQDTHSIPCPYGAPGDRLWVREAWHRCPHCEPRLAWRACGWRDAGGSDGDDHDDRPLNRKCAAHGWRPSIHMPRWASRLTMEVVSVRVERVQAISDADIAAEGVDAEAVRALWEGATVARRKEALAGKSDPDRARAALLEGTFPPIDLWRIAWTLINGAASWLMSPWCWVMTFSVVWSGGPTCRKG